MESLSDIVQSYYNYLKNTLASSIIMALPSVGYICTQFGFYFTIYLLMCYVTYFVSTVFRSHLSRSEYFGTFAKRVLIVTAHPDDECMFFGPVIVRLIKSRKYVFIMCLSNGNADNKGHIRKKELYKSCKTLGIPTENILLCCSPLRMDGHQYRWKSDTIASLIKDHVETFEIDTVVTFDKHGVSGHNNHIALFQAVSFIAVRNMLPVNCHIFLLDSLGIMRKYSSLMDCAMSVITSENVFILSPHEHELVKVAMRQHWTQLVWYRRLYMCFSRYTYVNTFYELLPFQG